MGGSKALKDEAANTGKTGGAPAAADGETGVGGDGGEGDQTSLLAGGVEGSDGKKKGVKVGKGGMSLLRGSSGDEKKKKKKKLSFAERVELQNQKDEATKKKKQEAEMKRLKKLKDMQDERERIRKEKVCPLRDRTLCPLHRRPQGHMRTPTPAAAQAAAREHPRMAGFERLHWLLRVAG
jgi:hypothetical protein